MSFLGFGKSKKNQSTALPAATRDIASSHGAESRVPTANGIVSPSGVEPNGMQRRGTVGNQSQQASVNASLESMRGMATPLAEPGKALRERAESDLNVSAAKETLAAMMLDQACGQTCRQRLMDIRAHEATRSAPMERPRETHPIRGRSDA
jgi:hypothetical protein